MYAEHSTTQQCFYGGVLAVGAVRDSIKVAIADDESSCRQLHAWLQSVEDIAVVGEAQDEQGALALVRAHQPDVLLLSLEALRSKGPEIIAEVRDISRNTQVIVWNSPGQEHLVLEAVRQGALGHLVREETSPDDIIRAVRAVHRGEAALSPALAGRILDEVIRRSKQK